MSESVTEEAPTPAENLFSIRTIAILLAVGVFCASAFAVLSAYAPDLKSGSDGGGHALSESAIGYAGLTRFLKDAGDPVLISRGPAHASVDAPGVLILTPGFDTDPELVAKTGFDGPTLVVLPKWVVEAHPKHRGWVRRLAAARGEAVTTPLTAIKGSPAKDASPAPASDTSDDQTDEAEASPTILVPSLARRSGASQPVLSGSGELFGEDVRLPLGRIDALQTLSGRGWIPILTDEQGRAVFARRDGTNLYVLSDPDILDTQGLKSLENARAASAIVEALRDGSGPVIVDVTLHGFSRGRVFLKLAMEPPFLGLTLCLLAVAALMGWHAFTRFGAPPPPARAFALGKRALADNSAALIRLAKREPAMGAGYAALERNTVVRLIGAPRNLSPEELDALLDRIAETKGVEGRITQLTTEAAVASDIDALMRVAAKLHRWRLEMTRERR
ncbi:MAG: hypothetical protein JSR45_14710 [Proteobacteria bacterium]|nr:hypothetical protein [Pseudomonadota bacterium]